MKSICIKHRAARRGVAEIELMLLIIVLFIPLLLLIGTVSTMGKNVLAVVLSAENDAYRQEVGGWNRQESQDPVPLDGIAAVRPPLPNRLLYAAPSKSAVLDFGAAGKMNFTYSEKAAFLDANWGLYGADSAAMAAWFDDYVQEDHPPALVQSLGLQPAGPP